MSFGFSVGDFVAVGSLAWNIYQSSRHASAQFEELGRECLSIHIAIKETETVPEGACSLLDEKASKDPDGLAQLSHNCKETLGQLDAIIKKYRSLGTMQKRQWDRIQFGREQLGEIRLKLLVHLSAINTFFNVAQLTVMTRIEAKIDQIALEIKRGVRAPSELSMKANDNEFDWVEDDYLWRQLRTELEEDGITSSDVEKEKETIKEYIRYLFLGEELDLDDNTLRPEDSMSMILETTPITSASNATRGGVNLLSLKLPTSTEEDWISFKSFETKLETNTNAFVPPKANLESTTEKLEEHLTGAESEANKENRALEPPKTNHGPGLIGLENHQREPRTESPRNIVTPIQKTKSVTEKRSDAVRAAHQAYFHGKLKATQDQESEVFKFLKENGSDIDSTNIKYPDKRNAALFLGVQHGHEPTVRLMLDYGANVEARDVNERTPLHYAAKAGLEKSVKLLVERKSAIDAFDNAKMTPFTMAAKAGHIDILQYFLSLPQLSKSYKTNLANRGYFKDAPFGYYITMKTPLDCALENGHRAVITLLLDSGAIATNDMLVNAVTARQVDIAKLLWTKTRRGILTMTVNDRLSLKDRKTLLHIASENGDLKMAEWLISQRADVNARFLSPIYRNEWERTLPFLRSQMKKRNGTTPLSLAASKGYEPLVELLLESHAEVDSVDDVLLTPLQQAVFNGHSATARTLLGRGADHAVKDEKARTLLEVAASNGNESMVRLLIQNGADTKTQGAGYRSLPQEVISATRNNKLVSERQVDGWTLLHFASWGGNAPIVRLLLEHSVPEKPLHGRVTPQTPIVIASGQGNLEVVKVFLERVVPGEERKAAREAAANSGELKVLRCLLENEPASRRGKVASSLLWDMGRIRNDTNSSEQLRLKRLEVRKLLLTYDADVNAKDGDMKETPLHKAAQTHDVDLTQFLLEHAAEVDNRDALGQTPLHKAVKEGNNRICQLLVEHGADIAVKDLRGRTALHHVCGSRMSLGDSDERSREKIVRLLVKKGADPMEKDGTGLSALERAKNVLSPQRRRFFVSVLQQAVKDPAPI